MPSVIDSHVHLYPEAINRDPRGWATAHGEPRWEILCTRRRKNGRAVQGFPGVDELLREMDRAGVERAVLLGWYWERAENCAAQNRFYAECVRAWPERLSAFAAVQPAAGTALAAEELRRAQGEGFLGIGELSPHAQGYAMDGPGMAAVMTVAADLRWPVNLHVTDPQGRAYPGRVETPIGDFVGLARAWPTVRLILAHWGGGAPLRNDTGAAGAAVDAADGGELANVVYDTAASPLLYGAEVWREFSAKSGAGAVLFGSDYPLNNFPAVEAEPEMARLLAEVRGAGLGEAELAAVLGGNARRVLGL